MRPLIPTALLALAMLVTPGCPAEKAEPTETQKEGEKAGDKGAKEKAGDKGAKEKAGDKGAKEKTDTKYVIGGKVRPAWVETLKLVSESLTLSFAGSDPKRAGRLAMAATDLAAEHPLLLGYTEINIAIVELRRGKVAAFEKLALRGLTRVPVDTEHTEIALLAAEESVRRGRLDPSRKLLGMWLQRLLKAKEDKLAEMVERKAKEHLQRVRGVPDKPAEKPKKKLKPPSDDFPIVLPP